MRGQMHPADVTGSHVGRSHVTDNRTIPAGGQAATVPEGGVAVAGPAVAKLTGRPDIEAMVARVRDLPIEAPVREVFTLAGLLDDAEPGDDDAKAPDAWRAEWNMPTKADPATAFRKHHRRRPADPGKSGDGDDALHLHRAVGSAPEPAPVVLSRHSPAIDDGTLPAHWRLFIGQADLVMQRVRTMLADCTLAEAEARSFRGLLVEAAARVMCHPVIAANGYLTRFAAGVTESQARQELQQFSVFAVQFDVAQAMLVANAPTEEAYEERLKVLLNEKGIPYRHGFSGELSGRWRPDTVHFAWLRHTGAGLGLGFADLGRMGLAHAGTRALVETVMRTYAGEDQAVAAGAAFGIENWAANALWKPWIAGMRVLNDRRAAAGGKPVDLAYLLYHDREEEHHSQATLDELFDDFREPWFDRAWFFAGAEAVLTAGVQAYYEDRLAHLPERDATWPDRAVG